MENVDGRAIFTDKYDEDIQSLMKILVHKIQEEFCEEIQKLEECKTFSIKRWKNIEGAGGITHILEDGAVFEKVGVYTSVANGVLPSSVFLLLKGRDDCEAISENPVYFTAGVSGIVYPKNPHIPTLSFSYRYFEMKNGNDYTWWFGGGTDLTPYLLNIEDCQHFHKVLKKCCDEYNEHYYRTFKKSCDEHFYLQHRGERRGIGGIFFSELNFPNRKICFEFVSTCMKNIIPSYMPIVLRNKDKKYFSEDKEWQLIQRGRYVEFLFICDKATKYALMTPGVEYENILINLPPLAKWQCSNVPVEKSKQSELINVLHHPIEWV